MAEAIFIDLARARGVLDCFQIDSCGTGHWHVGDGADTRAIETLRRHDVPINHTARQLNAAADADQWDLFVVMDLSNRSNVLAAGLPAHKVRLMGSFDPHLRSAPEQSQQVPDPYTGTMHDFEHVYDMLTKACSALLDELLADGRARP